MFFRKKVYIEGLGDLDYHKAGYFDAKLRLWNADYEIQLLTETKGKEIFFTDAQQNAFQAYVKIEQQIQDCIKQYYEENYHEIVTEYYLNFQDEWESCCKLEEEFQKIIANEEQTQKQSLELLLRYFSPQSITFFENGDCVLLAFLAENDDHGIAVTIFPQLEIMSQDEYLNERRQ